MNKILTCLMIMILLSGCRSLQYVPVETVRTEYNTNTVHDSIYLEVLKHDSVVIMQNNDTVYVTKFHYLYRDKYKDKIITDTVIKTDSIQVPCYIEKPLSKWKTLCINAGRCLFLLGIVLIAFLFFKVWKGHKFG